MAIIDIPRSDGSIVKCDTEAHTLAIYRLRVRFTATEWKIAKKLYENLGQPVKREALIRLIWGNEEKSDATRTVDVHISSIRKKLAYIRGARIDSIYGLGYRLLMLKRF